jgi:hypothetical protein
MTNPTLSSGGTFNADVGTDLLGIGTTTLILDNTVFSFVTGISIQGFIPAGEWIPIPGGNISQTKVYYSITAVNKITFRGLNLGNINGANVAVRPSFGTASGFLVTITLNYE